MRMFASAEQTFAYFASHRFTDKHGITIDTEITPEVFIANITPGKKVTVMNVRDFYNCLTPGSKVRAKGRGNFINLREEDLGPEMYRIERLPLPDDSFLNSICREGLLTYTDFYFLLNIVATPSIGPTCILRTDTTYAWTNLP